MLSLLREFLVFVVGGWKVLPVILPVGPLATVRSRLPPAHSPAPLYRLVTGSALPPRLVDHEVIGENSALSVDNLMVNATMGNE
jgi:hypothetical protein